MSFFNKVRWVISILLVFFIVLMTNIIDRNNYSKLSASVTTMYEDRLVAMDLLFDISRIIRARELELLANAPTGYIHSNEHLNSLLETYKRTRLINEEKKLLDDLEKELNILEQREKAQTPYAQLQSTLENIHNDLEELSKIQLQEGRNQVFISTKAMNTINLFTKGEMIFLIIMSVLVQIIILYKPR